MGWKLSVARLALLNLGRRPVRTALALVGLTVPLFALLGLLSLSGGIRGLAARALANVHGIIVVRKDAPNDLHSDLPASLGDRIAALPGVRCAVAEVWKMTPPIEGRNAFDPSSAERHHFQRKSLLESLITVELVVGVDMNTRPSLRYDLYRDHMVPPSQGGGRFLRPDDESRPHILISAAMASEYAKPDGQPLRAGDHLTIGRTEMCIVGLYNTGSMIFDRTIVMGLDSARRLLGVGLDRVSSFLVEPVDPGATESVASSIVAALPEVDARTSSDLAARVRRMVARLDLLLFLVTFLALVVGAIGVLNTMLMSVTERIKDLGVLRANGWSRWDVAGMIGCESTLLGLAGGVLASALAAFAVPVFNRLVLDGLRLELGLDHLALGLGLSVGLGLLGGLIPAWKAAQMRPIEAIRRGSR